jgi:hypothetical protein
MRPGYSATFSRKDKALTLSRRASDLQGAIAGYVNVRETDNFPSANELIEEIIALAEELKED